MDKSSKIVTKAKTQVNCSCYVWGARGQDLLAKADPPSWVYSMEQADSGYTKQQNTDRTIARLQKLKSKGFKPILAFDCSGFVYWCFHSVNLMSVRRNAQGYFNHCAEKSREDLRAGDLVFHRDTKKVSHIGIYIGGGKVIHCKGRDLGVVEEPLTAYGWNLFGKWDGVYDDDTPAATMVKALGTVRVRSLPSAEGKKLGTTKDGDTYPYLGTEATGWYAIDFNGAKAYISNKYTKLV